MSYLKIFLFLGVLNSLVMENQCNETPDKEWWENTLVYQLWTRAFQDSDGDGEGDIKGIISRLDYLDGIGIESILLSPIYVSPMIDSGYDVENYTDINPSFGTLEDFDNLVNDVHDLGMKLILDIVPNHSSDKNEWFVKSVKNLEPYENYYIWANGTVDDDGTRYPPNNWLSIYDDTPGSAWTWNDDKKQWYYHKFHPSQPDLNLRNENVIEQLLEIFDFWLERDVDGFRISTVSYFHEDEQLRHELPQRPIYTSNLPENIDLIYKFRNRIDNWAQTNNESSKVLIAEFYDADSNVTNYKIGAHSQIVPINFRLITSIDKYSNAKDFKTVLEEWLQLLPKDTSTNWILTNQDQSRVASRMGLNRVNALHVLSLLLPGQAFTYYGEEIAMSDVDVPLNETIDPMASDKSENNYERYSRDPARTPMQWDTSVSAGFSTNEKTYLPVHPDYTNINVQVQLLENNSYLQIYRKLAALRKQFVFTHGRHDFAALNNNNVLVVKRYLEDRPVYVIVMNLGTEDEIVDLNSLYPDLNDVLYIVVESGFEENESGTVAKKGFLLKPDATLVLSDQKIVVELSDLIIEESTSESSTPEASTEGIPITEESLVSDEEISILSTTESNDPATERDSSKNISISKTEEPEVSKESHIPDIEETSKIYDISDVENLGITNFDAKLVFVMASSFPIILLFV